MNRHFYDWLSLIHFQAKQLVVWVLYSTGNRSGSEILALYKLLLLLLWLLADNVMGLDVSVTEIKPGVFFSSLVAKLTVPDCIILYHQVSQLDCTTLVCMHSTDALLFHVEILWPTQWQQRVDISETYAETMGSEVTEGQLSKFLVYGHSGSRGWSPNNNKSEIALLLSICLHIPTCIYT